jgi:threonine synthase
MTFFSHLQCAYCSRSYPADELHTYCLECNSPLFARYDLESAKQALDRDEFPKRCKGIWRWQELLPVEEPENRLYLGEGDVPLLRLTRLGGELGLSHLFLKDESLNPTGTFKARGLSVAVSKAKELGVKKVIIPTAGNAGGAMAAYAGRGGLEAYVVMPKDSPETNILESQISGATVELVDGLISDAAKIAQTKAEAEGWFGLSTFKEPYRVEGKKIMGYELAESFGWELPETIIYPTGGGTGLVGMWKAFDELEALGWLENGNRPRMVAVQASGCAPVIKAFHAGEETCEFWADARTVASGLKVPKSFADRLILKALRDSEGTAVAVSDQEILNSQKRLAHTEGVFAAPEGAATLAGLIHLIRQKWIDPDERIVLFNTGTGLKYIDL